MKPADARGAALDVLVRVEKGTASDRALDRALQQRPLERRDRALATELVYGVLRRRSTLDAAIARHSRRSLDQLDFAVLAGLRLGVYQVLFLDRVPDHAALDSVVEAVKARRPKAAGFVNGILRAFLRQRGAQGPGGELVDSDWATRLDVPRWWAERWRDRYGDERSEDWFAAALLPVPLVLRRHPRVVDKDQLVRELAAEGVEVEESGHAPGSLVVTAGNPVGSDLLGAGSFSLRSDASQLVASLLSTDIRGRLLDACAGRGGKSIQIAEDTAADMVVAHDLSAWRLAACREAARRARTPEVRAVAGDLSCPGAFRTTFSAILVDAPCSGLGTVRRRPELKWRNDPQRLERLAGLQRQILTNAAALLADGGLLLYVTCSTEPEENERVVEAVVEASPDLVAEAVDDHVGGAFVGPDGYFRTYPGYPELDGFFAAMICRHRS